MLEKKKKLTKKQIKEDKLVTSYYQAQKFYEDNQSKILLAVGAIAIIIVAVFWYSSKVEQENLTATTELARVIPLYEQGSYLEAIDGKPGTNIMGLIKIVDEFGGSDQGEVARIYLANAYYFTGKIDEALEEYDNYSGSNKLLSASAIAGKAACYEAKENFKEASNSYEKAANIDKYNPQNPDYLLSAGKNYIKAGDKENAEEVLKELKESYKNSQAAREADKYLSYLDI